MTWLALWLSQVSYGLRVSLTSYMVLPGSTGDLLLCKREKGAVSWSLQAKIREIERFLGSER